VRACGVTLAQAEQGLGSGDQVWHYVYGGDLTVGIVTAMEHPDACKGLQPLQGESTTVLHLAEVISRKIKRPGMQLRINHDDQADAI
jgi:UDP-glucose 4-epimerase